MTILANLFHLVLLCVPAALAGLVSARLSRSSKEEWALLAWVPPLPLLAFGLYLGIAWFRDPTGGNLWPFVMAGLVVVTVALFGIFLAARKFLESDDTPPWRRRDRKA
ncbi:MAG TPA: hypothetical protein VK636_06730 [Gemmatimonadaceae bacterium]|nr:hypothetical protein [Gemmatimonadaceae bacterium]